ncbi:transcription factor subunit Med10 of mediator complex-domain-containing protein [Kalaharituber pfeilii]|nr:transcription factor subunit Med10 of mediator complex-domain-containing protein [Kalaharituber pfeilii]
MAPSMTHVQGQQLGTPLDNVEKQLRSIIQTLFEASVAISDYAGSSSTELIASQMNRLVSQYQELDRTKETLDVTIPREIVMYVEDGRNPDIYTREFVEIVAKQNQFMNGKMRAFGDFRDILADQIVTAFPELEKDVELVLKTTAVTKRKPKIESSEANGTLNGPVEGSAGGQ